MATKSKLEAAIEAHASSLNDAQGEIVRSQFSVYKANNARMDELSSQLAAINSGHAATREEVRAKQADRASVSYEYNQLATANSRIAAELFDLLGER